MSSQVLNKSDSSKTAVVINNAEGFEKSIAGDSMKRIVLLEKYVKPLLTDLRYASKNNFTHRILYRHAKVFVRLPVALALKRVQDELAAKNLSLVFFDAYRPYSVSKKMWKVTPYKRYVANPAKGSMHNRGLAVDVSLANLSTGEKVAMPTDFDDFSEKAHHDYMQLGKDTIANRLLLKTVMEKHGFRALQTEWWHYGFGNGNKFELLDLSFDVLMAVQ